MVRSKSGIPAFLNRHRRAVHTGGIRCHGARHLSPVHAAVWAGVHILIVWIEPDRAPSRQSRRRQIEGVYDRRDSALTYHGGAARWQKSKAGVIVVSRDIWGHWEERFLDAQRAPSRQPLWPRPSAQPVLPSIQPKLAKVARYVRGDGFHFPDCALARRHACGSAPTPRPRPGTSSRRCDDYAEWFTLRPTL